MLFVLLAFTGLRIREALALTWADIDLEQDLLRVERQLADDDRRLLDVKTANALRELPLYPRLRRVLVEHKLASLWNADDDPVFAAGRRKPKGYRNARRALAEAVKEAKITVAQERAALAALAEAHVHVAPDRRARARRRDNVEARRPREPGVTMRVYADDFRKATERNAAVLARAAERGFGT